jgi:hypothetical protein
MQEKERLGEVDLSHLPTMVVKVATATRVMVTRVAATRVMVSTRVVKVAVTAVIMME